MPLIQIGHLQKTIIHKNITVFKQIHIFTQRSISEYLLFPKIYQWYHFLITILMP